MRKQSQYQQSARVKPAKVVVLRPTFVVKLLLLLGGYSQNKMGNCELASYEQRGALLSSSEPCINFCFFFFYCEFKNT